MASYSEVISEISQPKVNNSIANKCNTKDNAFTRKQRIQQQRKSLPIASVEKRILEEVRNHDTLIMVGETGSKKTTCRLVSKQRERVD